jgi:nicotinamide-nucleotide amidase
VIAEIIAIGSEMLTPYRQDTNSLFLTERLNELGISVAFKTVVGDNLDHLISVARSALGRSDVIIFMGGLGPTQDDLTREAVAAALGIELKRDHTLVTAMYTRFAERRLQMPENNAQQADVLQGAVVLPNTKGTAPGQWLETEFEDKPRMIALLPGPPHELHTMWDAECMPRLREKVPPSAIASRVLKVAMMGESAVDLRAAPIYKKYPNVETTVLAGQGQVEFHLRATAATKEEAQAEVDRLAGQLEDEFDDAVFSSQGESLEEIVNYYLQTDRGTHYFGRGQLALISRRSCGLFQ